MKKAFLASLVSVFILSSLGMVVYASQGKNIESAKHLATGQIAHETGGPHSHESDGPDSIETEGPDSPETEGPSSDSRAITLDNPFRTGDSLVDLLTAIFNEIIFPIGGALAVLAFIYSGFKYVTAQGDTTEIQTAHQALLYTAVGTAILLGARVVAEVISNTVDKLK